MVEIVLGDITKQRCDAIVNAANEQLSHGGGVAWVISVAAGEELQKECKEIGYCPKGEAVITTGGNLPSKYVIHTVGPIYSLEKYPSVILKNAYKNSLELALKKGIKTIAFPSISTGIYGYPIKEASKIALKVLLEYEKKFEKIVMVLFSEDDFKIYKENFDKLKKGD